METSRYRFVIKGWGGNYSLYFATEEEGWAKVEQDKLCVQDVYKTTVKKEERSHRGIISNEPNDAEFRSLRKSFVSWLVRIEQIECTRPKRSEIMEWKERFEQEGWPLPISLRHRLEGQIPVLEG